MLDFDQLSRFTTFVSFSWSLCVMLCCFFKLTLYSLSQSSFYAPMTAQAFTELQLNVPGTIKTLSALDEDVREQYKKNVLAETQSIIDSGSPIMWENLILVAFV